MNTEHDPAARAEEAIYAAFGYSGPGMLVPNAQDLMSDLLHLVEREDGPGMISEFIRMARKNYEAERYERKEY